MTPDFFKKNYINSIDHNFTKIKNNYTVITRNIFGFVEIVGNELETYNSVQTDITIFRRNFIQLKR
jgi:hypothetical protein